MFRQLAVAFALLLMATATSCAPEQSPAAPAAETVSKEPLPVKVAPADSAETPTAAEKHTEADHDHDAAEKKDSVALSATDEKDAVAKADPPADGGEKPAASETPADPKSDAAARELIGKMTEFYKTVKTVSFQQEHSMNVSGEPLDPAGEPLKEEFAVKTSVVVERPNRFSYEGEEGPQQFSMFSDGETLTLYVPSLDKYSQEEAPETLPEVATNPLIGRFGGGIAAMTFNLFDENAFTEILEVATEVKLLGREKIGEHETEHISFKQEDLLWGLWIDADGDPVLRQIMFDMSQVIANSGQQVPYKNVKMIATLRYEEWSSNQPPAGDAFAFVAPEGAQKVDSLFGGPQQQAEEPSPLLGKAAPPAELKLLDGGDVSLEQHREKEVVMLDFWATWCGPCVAEMPILVEVAKEYAEKGVAFYAVNQQEEPADIEAFLKEHELSMKVALDSMGKVGDLYGVTGLPTLVLIDRAGVVQAVHRGYHPSIKDILREELDALLAGKSLLEEAAKEDEKPSDGDKPADASEAEKPAADDSPNAPALPGPEIGAPQAEDKPATDQPEPEKSDTTQPEAGASIPE